MPDSLKNVLLLVSSHHAVTSRFYLWMLHKVMLLLSWLHCSAASTKTTSNKWNIGHQLSQIPKEFASAIYRNYCSYTVGIKIILAITTSSSAHQPHLFYRHRPRAGSTVCICEENDQAPNPDCLAVISVRVCVMISLAYPGSALIDLLNAEIDCREAEQPYWSAAFIIHSVWGARGEAADWMT